MIESDGGDYLAAPIVFDADGNVIMGREVLETIVESGVTVQCPMLREFSPGDLAALDE